MNKLEDAIRRIAMTGLFLLALITTFQSISGVKAQTLVKFTNLKIEEIKHSVKFASFLPHTLSTLRVSHPSIRHIAREESVMPVSSTAAQRNPTLEDSIDWSQYPKETVIATGYTAGYESTGKSRNNPEYGITYSGVKVKRDLYSTIAADLNVFPIGTILFIPGYGYGVVADKGGAIKGNRLDLYYETVHDVYQLWGKKKLDVYVIKKGNGNLTEDGLRKLNEDESMQVFRQHYTKSERR